MTVLQRMIATARMRDLKLSWGLGRNHLTECLSAPMQLAQIPLQRQLTWPTSVSAIT